MAKGHVRALEKLDEANQVYTYNLGSGQGTSVLELVNTFIQVTGVDVPYRFAPNRAGDLPSFMLMQTKLWLNSTGKQKNN